MIYIDKLNNAIVDKVLDSIKLEANGYVVKSNNTINDMILFKHLMNIHTDKDTNKNNKIEHAYSNLINNYD